MVAWPMRAKRSAGTFMLHWTRPALLWPAEAIGSAPSRSLLIVSNGMGWLGMAGMHGLAQANLEINAVFGILLAAFVFVPLYLRLKVVTISQFFEQRFGPRVALAYSVLTMVLYGFLYLGTTLFWGAYAVNALFAAQIGFLGADPAQRARAFLSDGFRQLTQR